MGSKRLRARRERRWIEDPRCQDCGVETIPPELVKKGQRSRMATLEHLDSRLNPMRGSGGVNEIRTTILCYKCNQKRALLEQHFGPGARVRG